jgi:ring-1,2-phenylacetyl-CoA epoxidase subunit PaaD
LVSAATAPVEEGLVAKAWEALSGVPDPEIPVVSVIELGIIREVRETGDGVEVAVTPTYAGCPATEVIAADIVAALRRAGLTARVVRRLAPPWTTDWITPQGRAQLKAYGIAPPGRTGTQVVRLVRKLGKLGSDPIFRETTASGQEMGSDPISCPQCESGDVERLSEFGSTPCKALYRCRACREPLDYMKPL